MDNQLGNKNGRLDSGELAGLMKATEIPAALAAKWQTEFDKEFKGKGAPKATAVAFAARHMKEIANWVIEKSNGTITHDDIRDTLTGCWTSGNPDSAPC